MTVDWWSIDLNSTVALLPSPDPELCPDEHIRFNQIRSTDRKRYRSAARGAMRRILSIYLNCAPGQIAFKLTRHGKPMIAEPIKKWDLHFNLSHSEAMAVLAVSKNNSVGIDIEFVKDIPERATIQKMHFSEFERECIKQLPAADQLSAFYRIWTAKEAVLKMTGSGLSGDLGAYQIDIASDPPCVLNTHQTEGWRLFRLDTICGYVGTLAVATRQSCGLNMFNFP